ncbi:hypothetical protein RQP46_008323 [Phenoliferia psychrophenolica]
MSKRPDGAFTFNRSVLALESLQFAHPSDSPNKKSKPTTSPETTKSPTYPLQSARTGVCVQWKDYGEGRFYGGILDDEATKLGLKAVPCSPKVLLDAVGLVVGQRVKFEYIMDGGKPEAYRVKVDGVDSPAPPPSPSESPPAVDSTSALIPNSYIRMGRGQGLAVKYRLHQGVNGYSATHLEIDPNPLPMPKKKQAALPRIRGTIHNFDNSHHFGHILGAPDEMKAKAPDCKGKVYCHLGDVTTPDGRYLAELHKGDLVEFSVGHNDKGLERATQVVLIQSSSQSKTNEPKPQAPISSKLAEI